MFICSQLPETHFCKKLSPAHPEEVVPIPGAAAMCQGCWFAALREQKSVTGTENLKPQRHFLLSKCPVLWPWQEKGQQLFCLMGGDNWRGHMAVFGKRKSLLGFWSCALLLGQSLPGDSRDIVSVGRSGWVISKLKPPGFLCHRLTAHSVWAPWSFRGFLGIPLAQGGPQNPFSSFFCLVIFKVAKYQTVALAWVPTGLFDIPFLVLLNICCIFWWKYVGFSREEKQGVLSCSGAAGGKWLK